MTILRTPPRGRRAALAVAVVLAVGGARGGDPGARFVPDGKARGDRPSREGVYEAERAGCSIDLVLLGDAERAAFLKRAGVARDPFAPAPGFPSGFVVFRVRVANRGNGDVVFQPQAARLEFGKHDVRSPVAWTDVVEAYGVLGAEPPPEYVAARSAIFDGEVVLPPGARAEGLLPFRRLPAETRRFRAAVGATTGSGESVAVEAAYRRADGRP